MSKRYGIRNKSGIRYQGTKRLYSEFYPLNDVEIYKMPKPDTVIVEDSNSAFNFYSSVFSQYGINCISANANSNIFRLLTATAAETVLVIADSEAFGAEIERIPAIRKVRKQKAVKCCLSSGLLFSYCETGLSQEKRQPR